MVIAQTKAKTNTNPFLNANFAAVQTENVFSNLMVNGTIPADLEGRFLRIGPNPVSPPSPKSYHWFMGSGMVHGLRIKDSQAQWYRNNFVLTDGVADSLKRKQLPAPRKTRNGSVNTNVLAIGGELFALVEAGSLPVKLNANLESVEHSDFSGTLKRGFTAHPRKDPVTGELHALIYEPGKGTIDYAVVNAAGQARYAGEIHAPHQPMIHDTAITQSSVIVLDLPLTFDMVTAITGKFPYIWNRRQQPRVGLFPRDAKNGAIVWFEAPECAVYHVMNAFDVDDKVVVDVIKNSMNFDADILKRPNKQRALVRWTLNRSTGKLSETQLSDYSVEFPRINDSFVARSYRYGYTATITNELKFGAAHKHDLHSATTLVHDFGPGRSAMEPVFVPRLGATVEDDGWLLSYVFDENSNTTDVVILDARDFEGAAVATIQLPVRVPYGFHGNWISDSELSFE